MQTYRDFIQWLVAWSTSTQTAISAFSLQALDVFFAWRRLMRALPSPPVATPEVVEELTYLLTQTQAGNVTATAFLIAISQTDNDTSVFLQNELNIIASGP